MSNATQVPSFLSALIEKFSDGNGQENPMLGIIKGIGATMAAAKVSLNAGSPNPADIGVFALDFKLPGTVAASTQTIDGTREAF